MKKAAALLLSFLFASFSPARVAAADVAVSADSAILIVADSEETLFEKMADEKRPMASTTKIMTCLLAAESCDLSDTVKIPPESVGIEGSSMYFKEGDEVSVKDLIYAAMLRSANDSASALAVHTAGSEEAFIELMNEKAAKLGMTSTHFSNPHGLPADDHYTTARDFARLALYAMSNGTIAEAAGTKEYVVTVNGCEKRPVVNHNRLLFSYDGANGVKTGFTKASGRCLVSSAERNGVKLIAVTLGAPDDWNDHRRMLDFGFSVTEQRTVLEKGQIKRTFHLFGEGSVECENDSAVVATLTKGQTVTYRVDGDRFPAAPIKAGDRIAEVTVLADGREIGKSRLVATSSVALPKKKNLLQKIIESFS